MKKSLLFIAGIFCMILLLAGCPEIPGGGNGYDKLPSDVDPDGGTPVMGNPVVEQLAEIPTSIAGYTKVDTGKTLDGEKIYRLYGTYIYQVGDTYYLDGKYRQNDSLATFILGTITVPELPGASIKFEYTLENVTSEIERITGGYRTTKAGFVFSMSNGIYSTKYITFDGKTIYDLVENRSQYPQWHQIYYESNEVETSYNINDIHFPTYLIDPNRPRHILRDNSQN